MEIQKLLIDTVMSLFFASLIGYLSFKRRLISLSGLVGFVLIICILYVCGGWAWLTVFVCVSGSVSFWTKYKNRDKNFLDHILEKSGPRDIWQAAANFLVAILIVLLNKFYPSEKLISAFLGALTAATADTWATELGVLSKFAPRLITNFKTVARGTSGAVSFQGTIAGISGSIFIAMSGGIVFFLSKEINSILLIFISAAIGGMVGLLADSILGATIQASYYSEKLGVLTEKSYLKGEQTVFIKGYKWINNDWVNFLCTLFGSIMAYIIFISFR